MAKLNSSKKVALKKSSAKKSSKNSLEKLDGKILKPKKSSRTKKEDPIVTTDDVVNVKTRKQKITPDPRWIKSEKTLVNVKALEKKVTPLKNSNLIKDKNPINLNTTKPKIGKIIPIDKTIIDRLTKKEISLLNKISHLTKKIQTLEQQNNANKKAISKMRGDVLTLTKIQKLLK